MLRLAEMVPPAAAGWDSFIPGQSGSKVIFPAGRGRPVRAIDRETGVRRVGRHSLQSHYDDDRHIRLGFDHWKSRGPLSAPLALEPRAEQELVVMPRIPAPASAQSQPSPGGIPPVGEAEEDPQASASTAKPIF